MVLSRSSRNRQLPLAFVSSLHGGFSVKVRRVPITATYAVRPRDFNPNFYDIADAFQIFLVLRNLRQAQFFFADP